MCCHICSLRQHSSFERCLSLLFEDHRGRAVRLRHYIGQAWLCRCWVMLLFQVLYDLSCLFPVSTVIRVHLSLFLDSRYRLRVSNLRCHRLSLHDFRGFWLSSGFSDDHLWVLLNLHGDFMLIVLHSKFLNIEFFPILFWHLRSRDTRVHIMDSVFELSFLISINEGNTDWTVKFHRFLIVVKQYEVVAAYIDFCLLGFETVWPQNSKVDIGWSKHFDAKITLRLYLWTYFSVLASTNIT